MTKEKKSDMIQFFKDNDAVLFNKKNSVRNLISDSHWQSDRVYKEALIKQILEDKLSGTKFHVGTGFVIDKIKQIACPKQIDILIFEKNPTHVFRYHDFYIIDVDSFRAAIEVKTRIEDSIEFKEALIEASKVGKFFVDNKRIYMSDYFIGLFSYEGYEEKKSDKKNLKEKMETVFNDQTIRDIITDYGVNFINLNRDILMEREGSLNIFEFKKQSYSYFIERLCDWLIDEKFLLRNSIGDKHHTPSPTGYKPKFKLKLSDYMEV